VIREVTYRGISFFTGSKSLCRPLSVFQIQRKVKNFFLIIERFKFNDGDAANINISLSSFQVR
jgi:hypothetical protein